MEFVVNKVALGQIFLPILIHHLVLAQEVAKWTRSQRSMWVSWWCV
jgi:hypothetical protein